MGVGSSETGIEVGGVGVAVGCTWTGIMGVGTCGSTGSTIGGKLGESLIVGSEAGAGGA